MRKERRDKGLYWDAAWKLVEGCTKVSPGCDNCWSETETNMRQYHSNQKINSRAFAVMSNKDGHENEFSGHIICRENNLELPLCTKKPTVFAIWNDLYHEDVPDDFRDRAYAVMALCPQHTFLVLTKRAVRMAEYFCGRNRPVEDCLYFFLHQPHLMNRVEKTMQDGVDSSYPLNNVWHGVTAENQQAANERIPYLLRVPGKRFLSIEPMLGPVILDQHINAEDDLHCDYCGGFTGDGAHDCYEPEIGIHAVLLGGESGKDARPMHPDWARSVRDQCEAADIPFTFKQWGEWRPPESGEEYNTAYGRSKRPASFLIDTSGSVHCFYPSDDNASSPENCRCKPMLRVGKKSAGRILDGRTHDSLPWDEA